MNNDLTPQSSTGSTGNPQIPGAASSGSNATNFQPSTVRPEVLNQPAIRELTVVTTGPPIPPAPEEKGHQLFLLSFVLILAGLVLLYINKRLREREKPLPPAETPPELVEAKPVKAEILPPQVLNPKKPKPAKKKKKSRSKRHKQ